MISTVLTSAGTKILALPIAGFGAIWTNRVLVEHTTTQVFSAAALAATIPALVPVSDLGVGVGLATAASRYGAGHSALQAEWRRAVYVTSTGGIALLAIGLALTTSAVWPVLLGTDLRGLNVAAAIATASLALAMPLGTAHRVLQGLGFQYLVNMLNTLNSLVPLVLIEALLPRHKENLPIITAAITVGPIISGLAGLLCVAVIGRGMKGGHQQSMVGIETPESIVLHSALPMAIIGICVPLAFQSDRLVISHLLGSEAVEQYSLASSLYAPGLGLFLSAGAALWPVFHGKGAPSDRITRLNVSLVLFATIGAAGAVGLAIMGPMIARLAYPGAAESGSLYACFAALLFVMALNVPASAFNSNPHGLWFQARLASVMLLINFPLSWLLTPKMGASGPLIASAGSALVVMVIPYIWFGYHQAKH